MSKQAKQFGNGLWWNLRWLIFTIPDIFGCIYTNIVNTKLYMTKFIYLDFRMTMLKIYCKHNKYIYPGFQYFRINISDIKIERRLFIYLDIYLFKNRYFHFYHCLCERDN